MKNLLFLLLCALFIVSCQPASDELASPSSSTKLEQRSNQSRPFTATLSAAINFEAGVPPTACSGDLPGLALLDYSVSGQATHLGNLSAASTLHHESCNLSVATMELTTSLSGQLVAANGDKLFYTADDVIDVTNFVLGSGPTGPITGTWTITGGTGKFENASGSFEINGLVDFTTLSLTFEANGTITY